MKRFIFYTLFIVLPLFGYTQTVYQSIQNKDIYAFIDLLASKKVIQINSAVKPYSRKLIAMYLELASDSKDQLNDTQQKRLTFYLKDYQKELNRPDVKKRRDLYFYNDSLFTLSINPIIGANSYWNGKKLNYHRWNGAEFFSYVGENVGMYGSLRDNYETEPFSNPSFLNKRTGGNYKSSEDGSGEYSEMRGGITFSNKWGSLALVKDHFTWGNNNFGANIFSDKAPSFPLLKFNLKPVKWLEINYIHSWLVSGVRDTISPYLAGAKDRVILVNKFLAANMITVKPFKHFHISLGNSIVYSDRFNPVFLIPLMFYKSIDHTLYYHTGNYGGQNAQMYLDISSRNINNTHLFFSWYIDELSIGRMWDKSSHSNFFSFKGGVKRYDIIDNLNLSAEITRTNPITYRHFVSTTTFESNEYNLGHYLRDNAMDFHLSAEYFFKYNLKIECAFSYAEKGEEYEYTGTNKSGLGLPFLSETAWKKNEYSINMEWQPLNDVYLIFGYSYLDVSNHSLFNYLPDFTNAKNQLRLQFNVGF